MKAKRQPKPRLSEKQQDRYDLARAFAQALLRGGVSANPRTIARESLQLADQATAALGGEA